MTPEPLRTYKYQLTADEFKFAFTATEVEFTERADELREKGVERLTGKEIDSRYRLNINNFSSRPYWTIMKEVEVESAISIENLQGKVSNLLLWRSSLPHLWINNCSLIILDEVNKTSYSTSIHLIDSIAGLSLYNTKLGNIAVQNTELGNLFIQHSTIKGFYIGKKSTAGDFNIENSTTGNFTIENCKSGNFSIEQSTTGAFSIRNCIAEKFVVSAQSKMGSLSIYASTVSDVDVKKSEMAAVYITQSTAGSFSFEQSTTGNLRINQSITGKFSIVKSTTGEFLIAKSTTGDFSINNSSLTYFDADGLSNSFNLIKVSIPQFRLKKCQLPEIRIGSGCQIECYVADSAINLIDLQHLTLSKESVVSLFDCSVYACLMDEFAVLGNLFFRQIKKANEPFAWYDPVAKSEGNEDRLAVLQEHAENYEKHKAKLANELNINQPTFRIAQSSLGKTEFTNCDLGGFRFEFNNAKITEVFMSGGTVPEKTIFIPGEPGDSLSWHEQKVSVYNQLKKIFEGQGDIYWATHFQAKTAEHQEKVLQFRRKDEKEVFSTTLWDLITFRLNKLSNLHGESWGRALAFTMITAAVFYLLYLWTIGRLFQPTGFDWNLAGQYVQFLDPVHKIDFVKDADLNFGAYVTDFVGRLFVGYGIYQFISAFRKHGRK